MIYVVDIALGALLGVSFFLLVLALASLRRSGLLSLLLVSIGLGIHTSFTVAILVLGHFTEMLSNVDSAQLLALDVAIFVAALLVGVLGGKAVAGSS
jgi:hypothetical protein